MVFHYLLLLLLLLLVLPLYVYMYYCLPSGSRRRRWSSMTRRCSRCSVSRCWGSAAPTSRMAPLAGLHGRRQPRSSVVASGRSRLTHHTTSLEGKTHTHHHHHQYTHPHNSTNQAFFIEILEPLIKYIRVPLYSNDMESQ